MTSSPQGGAHPTTAETFSTFYILVGTDSLLFHHARTFPHRGCIGTIIQNQSDMGGGLTEEALLFVRRLLAAPIEHIGLENPLGCISTRVRPYDQRIQPYEFGSDASKATCLWLKNLSPLIKDPTQRVAGRMVLHNGKMVERWANQTDSGQNRLGPSEERAQLRSVTYPGVARAMALQWAGKA